MNPRRIKRTLFLMVLNIVAALGGFFLGPLGFALACWFNRYHHGSGDWLDAHLLGCEMITNPARYVNAPVRENGLASLLTRGRWYSYGCHYNRKQGGYHCHLGPLAGQFFGSKEEMLKKLSADKTDAAKSKK
jgi:hypothetical protein